jgi:hypothetical protein
LVTFSNVSKLPPENVPPDLFPESGSEPDLAELHRFLYRPTNEKR